MIYVVCKFSNNILIYNVMIFTDVLNPNCVLLWLPNLEYSVFCISIPDCWFNVKIILHRIISKVWLPSSLSVTRNNSSHDDEAECSPLSGKRPWTNLVQGIDDRSGPLVYPGPGGGMHRLSGWTGNPLDLFTRTTWSTPLGEDIQTISSNIYWVLKPNIITLQLGITNQYTMLEFKTLYKLPTKPTSIHMWLSHYISQR